MKKLVIALMMAALISSPLVADPTSTCEADVTITVAEEASMWGATAEELTLNGANPENSDEVASSITHINNIPAQISVSVESDSGLSEDVNFFIFDNGGDTEAAYSAIQANANAPAGALTWTNSSLGTEKNFCEISESFEVTTREFVYAADAPNNLPEPQTNDLVVTWTVGPQD